MIDVDYEQNEDVALESAKHLIANNTDIDTVYPCPICEASKNGHFEVIKYLSKNGADLIYTGRYDGFLDEAYGAVSAASANGHLEIVKYLINNGALVSENNDSPICYASGKGHLEIVKYLFSRGANINGNNGEPIREASSEGHLEVLKYLVDNGADVNLHGKLQMDAYDEWDAYEEIYDSHNSYAIFVASKNGHLEIIKYLVENGAYVTESSNMAIRLARENKHDEIVKYLIDNGADNNPSLSLYTFNSLKGKRKVMEFNKGTTSSDIVDSIEDDVLITEVEIESENKNISIEEKIEIILEAEDNEFTATNLKDTLSIAKPIESSIETGKEEEKLVVQTTQCTEEYNTEINETKEQLEYRKDKILERNMTIGAYMLCIGGGYFGFNFANDGSTFLSIVSFIAFGFGAFWLWAIST